MRDDFITAYLSYTEDTEVPKFYHRWCCISMLGALLGREYYFRLGHSTINPNLYCMLIGSPGTRKSTGIKIAKKLLRYTGYSDFSADKSTKEKFLIDLEGHEEDLANTTMDAVLKQSIFGDDDNYEESDYKQVYVACDEFNDFIGQNNHEFISLLGSFWDYAGIFESRIKHGRSVKIPNPTVSILGGNTPVGFKLAFPPESLGQGFFSRLLLIYGEPTDKRITFPKPPSLEFEAELVQRLRHIMHNVRGEATFTPGAMLLVDKIYKQGRDLKDPRFESYVSRRLSHLIKLWLVLSAARLSTTINEEDVIYGHSLLTHTENLMPKALGEFGRGKHSEVAHKVLQVLGAANSAMKFKDMWTVLSSDLDNPEQLQTILRNLIMADKVQVTQEGTYLIKREVWSYKKTELLDFSFLTQDELDLL